MSKENEEKTDRVDDCVMLEGPSDEPAMPCIVRTSDTLADAHYWLSSDKDLTVGRASENDVCIRDQSVSQRHARIVLTPAGVVFVEDLGSTNGTYVNGGKVARQVLCDGDRVHIGPNHMLKFSHELNAAPESMDDGEAGAIRDALTGVYARQHVLRRIDQNFIRAKMKHADLALLMFDVDGFEEIMEQHGPRASDMVLREVAKVVSSVLRRKDVFARYDHHTFVILLRNLREAEVVVLAQRIGRVVKNHPFLHEGRKIGVTISLGIGSITRNMQNAMDLIVDVQAFLDKAKRAGRDTINGTQSMRVVFRQMANRHVA